MAASSYVMGLKFMIFLSVCLAINLACAGTVDSKSATLIKPGTVGANISTTELPPVTQNSSERIATGIIPQRIENGTGIAINMSQPVSNFTSNITALVTPVNATSEVTNTSKTQSLVPVDSPAKETNASKNQTGAQLKPITEKEHESVKPESTTLPSTRASSPAPSSVKTPAPTPPETTTASTPESSTKKLIIQNQKAQRDREFDGPSFIGGIVLALGLTGIGFVAYKFCKARTVNNYRNL